VLAAEHQVELALIEGRGELLDRLLQIGPDILAFARQLGADLRLLEGALQGARGLQLLVQAGAGPEDLLGCGPVAPEVRIGGAGFDLLQLARQGLQIKDAPGAPRIAS
jgi:hypothetical protein